MNCEIFLVGKLLAEQVQNGLHLPPWNHELQDRLVFLRQAFECEFAALEIDCGMEADLAIPVLPEAVVGEPAVETLLKRLGP